VDKYEEHLVRRLADLLYVPHSDFIRMKLRVIDDQDAGDVDPSVGDGPVRDQGK
jgi:hypothetical protein